MNSEEIKKIVEPVTNCISFIGEEIKIATLTQRSIIAMQHNAQILGMLTNVCEKHLNSEVIESIKYIISETPTEWAIQECESDFSNINAHNLVAVWGALENCIEDVIAAMIIYDKDSTDKLSAIGIRTKKDFQPDLLYEDARQIFKNIERKFRQDCDAMTCYEKCLAFFGLGGDLNEAHKENLNKANAIRNCLLHKSGWIDKKAAKCAPSLETHICNKIKLKTNECTTLMKAVSDYTLILLARIKTYYQYPEN